MKYEDWSQLNVGDRVKVSFGIVLDEELKKAATEGNYIATIYRGIRFSGLDAYFLAHFNNKKFTLYPDEISEKVDSGEQI